MNYCNSCFGTCDFGYAIIFRRPDSESTDANCALFECFKRDLFAFCITVMVLQEKGICSKVVVYRDSPRMSLREKNSPRDPLKRKKRCQRWRTASTRIANA